MYFLKEFFKLNLLQLIVVSVFVLLLTAFRFFDNKNFIELKKEYDIYADFDTKISYVYEGE